MGSIFNVYGVINWHVFFELIGIVMAFSIFTITYYTYEQTNKLTSIIISCVFLSTSLFVFLHILSCMGINPCFTSEAAQKSAIYWKLSRLIMPIGLFTVNIIEPNKRGNRPQLFFLLTTFFVIGLIVLLIEKQSFFFHILCHSITGANRGRIFEIMSMVLFVGAIIFYSKNANKIKGDKSSYFFMAGLISSTIGEGAFIFYTDIYDKYYVVGQLFRIISYYLYFRALFVINVQKPYRELHQAETEISEYAANLKSMVEERTSEIEKAQQKLEQDLDYAKNIQLALLPNRFPNVKGMAFAARYYPCEKVGGDFYNIFKLDGENVGILIGDVAGHGVSAAMLNVFINQKIHVKKEYDNGRYKIFTPRGVLMNLYHTYNEMPFPDEAYLVMLYCIYNTKTHELSYSSAGMNISPIILDANGNVRTIALEGFPICKFGKYFKPYYETYSIQLKPGDTMIFYTDGLVDMDRDNSGSSPDNFLVEFVKGMKGMNADEICNEIIDAYFTFVDRQEMLDDVTVLVVKTNR